MNYCMGKKELNNYIKTVGIKAPEQMEYYVNIETDKERYKYISRIEKIIRRSMEYRNYIQFLKDNMDLDQCIFFQNITSEKSSGSKRGRISIELHHEPFTLYDYVNAVVTKYQTEGIPLNDLMIADEVLKLHYENKVGLVPLSKTMHEVIHKSTKLIVPLNMVYGEYSQFLNEYEPYISDDIYEKLERKIDMTKNLTPESFEAIQKEFLYYDVDGFSDISKMESKSSTQTA